MSEIVGRHSHMKKIPRNIAFAVVGLAEAVGCPGSMARLSENDLRVTLVDPGYRRRQTSTHEYSQSRTASRTRIKPRIRRIAGIGIFSARPVRRPRAARPRPTP